MMAVWFGWNCGKGFPFGYAFELSYVFYITKFQEKSALLYSTGSMPVYHLLQTLQLASEFIFLGIP